MTCRGSGKDRKYSNLSLRAKIWIDFGAEYAWCPLCFSLGATFSSSEHRKSMYDRDYFPGPALLDFSPFGIMAPEQ